MFFCFWAIMIIYTNTFFNQNIFNIYAVVPIYSVNLYNFNLNLNQNSKQIFNFEYFYLHKFNKYTVQYILTKNHFNSEAIMKITDIKVRKLFDDGPMKAVVSVTFDDQLAVHDIKVINARDKFFIVMPSRKNPDETYRDIVHPINSSFRLELE